MKKIMILGASVLQVPAIVRAKQMNLQTVVLDSNKNAVGFEFADVSLNISTMDVNKVIEAAEKYKVDGIMTLATDGPINTIAAVNEKLGYSGIDRDTAFNVTNKLAMRDILKENSVPIPKYYRVGNLIDYLEIIEKIKGKFMVKAPDSSGSRGISLINSLQDSEELKKAYEYSMKYSGTGEIIVEEYMEGPEVSVESITVGGETTVVAITDKVTTGSPNFVEIGHSIPSQLEENVKKMIIDLTIKTINALNIRNSPTHVEIIVTENGPKIVEIGARLGGGNITTHLVPLATGVDLVEKSIELAMGKLPTIDFNNNLQSGSAIQYILPKPGRIKKIVVDSTVNDIKEVKKIGFFKKSGDLTNSLKDGSDRIGYVITKNNEVEKAINTAKKVIENNIEIEYEN